MPIDKGALVCCKGNHCAEPWVDRVRVSAHTVWRSKLQTSHKLLLCSPQRCRSSRRGHSQRKGRRIEAGRCC